MFTQYTPRLFGLTILVSACNYPAEVDPEGIIAYCSAGFGVSLSAEANAELKGVVTGGEVSASVRQEIYGAILASPAVNSENIGEIYADYLSCVQHKKSTAELSSLLEIRRDQYISFLEDSGADSDSIVEIISLMNQHISAVKSGQLSKAHELHRIIIIEQTKIEAELDADGPIYFPNF